MSGITRRCFVGGSLAAGGLMLCGTGCGGPPSVPVTGGIARLSFMQFPELSKAGGGVVVSANGTDIAVVRVAADQVSAVSAVCTHAGCTVDYSSSARTLDCPCHGSRFDPSGGVLHGPAQAPLPPFDATIEADAINVQVG